MNVTKEMIETVENFFIEAGCKSDEDPCGNITISFIGMPRMFTVRVYTAEPEGHIQGEGETLIAALKDLIQNQE